MPETPLTPGAFVRHPQQPDWGLGQIQSVIGHRATVGFEHRGKVLVDLRMVHLEPVDPDRRGRGASPMVEPEVE